MTREALALLVAVCLAGCSSERLEEPPGATPVTAAPTVSEGPVGACRTTYPANPLPPWATSGFSETKPSVPHVLSDRGDMVAIVWVAEHHLAAPPAGDMSNKILWVARIGQGDGPLRIRAVLQGTAQTVRRVVEPAPGPSIIDVPSPGCWSFDLTWGRHHDHLQLGYGTS